MRTSGFEPWSEVILRSPPLLAFGVPVFFFPPLVSEAREAGVVLDGCGCLADASTAGEFFLARAGFIGTVCDGVIVPFLGTEEPRFTDGSSPKKFPVRSAVASLEEPQPMLAKERPRPLDIQRDQLALQQRILSPFNQNLNALNCRQPQLVSTMGIVVPSGSSTKQLCEK